MDYTKCDSARDLEKKLDPILITLSLNESEDSWMKIDGALKNLSSLVTAGAYKYPALLVAIKENCAVISRSILTERTRLSGSALGLIEALAKSCPKEFKPLSNLFVSDLVKICARTNKVFSTRGSNCLNAMMIYGRCFDHIPLLCEYASNDQSKILRTHISKVILVTMQNIGTGDNQIYDTTKEKEEVKLYFDNIEATIASTAIDAEVNVRATARSLYDVYTKRFPENTKRLIGNLNPTAKKYLKIQTTNIPEKPGPKITSVSKSLLETRRLMASKKINPAFLKSSASVQDIQAEPSKDTEPNIDTDKERYKPQAVRRIIPASQDQTGRPISNKSTQPAQGINATTLGEKSSVSTALTNSATEPTKESSISKPKSESEPSETKPDMPGQKMPATNVNAEQDLISENQGFERAPLVKRKLYTTSNTAIAGQQTLTAVSEKSHSAPSNITTRATKKRSYDTSQIDTDHPNATRLGRTQQQASTFAIRAKKFAKSNDSTSYSHGTSITSESQPRVGLVKRTADLNLPPALQRKGREIRRKSIIRARQIAIIQSRQVVASSAAIRDKPAPKRTISHQQPPSVSATALTPNSASTPVPALAQASIAATSATRKLSIDTTIPSVNSLSAAIKSENSSKVPIHLRTTASSRLRNTDTKPPKPRNMLRNTNNLSFLNFGVQNPKSPLVKKFTKVTAKLGLNNISSQPKNILNPVKTPNIFKASRLKMSTLDLDHDQGEDKQSSSVPNKKINSKESVSLNFFSPSLNTRSKLKRDATLTDEDALMISSDDLKQQKNIMENFSVGSPAKNNTLDSASSCHLISQTREGNFEAALTTTKSQPLLIQSMGINSISKEPENISLGATNTSILKIS